LANIRNTENIDKTVRDCFLYLKFMFEYTGDSFYEKNMAVYQFHFILKQFEAIFDRISGGYDFIYDVIEMYLDCKYIENKDKNIFRKVMYNIELAEKKNKR
jgi:hypothetical protein